MEKIKVVPAERHPLCPHCGQTLNTVEYHKVKVEGLSMMGYTVFHSCPHCRKVLAATASQS